MRVVLTDYSETIVLVIALILLFAFYLSWTATRLDRLHLRLDAARIALDAQLVRRASVTLELAQSGLLDPASSLLLAFAASEARDAIDEDREAAESALTRNVRAAFDEPEQIKQVRADLGGAALLDELAIAAKRVRLARQFYNESVRTVRQLRSHRLVRAFRLAGRAPDKPIFDIDDALPDFTLG